MEEEDELVDEWDDDEDAGYHRMEIADSLEDLQHGEISIEITAPCGCNGMK